VPAAETLFQIEPPLAILTFNRPEARNAMTWAMYQALVAACDAVDRDDAVRVFVLRGAGGQAFSAGTDISQFQEFREPEDGVRYEQRVGEVLEKLEAVAKPTIAEVEGVAAGAGCAMALTCDLRVATPESSFGIPIARTLGNCVPGAAYSRLVDLAGPGCAAEILFTGRLVGAAEAQSIGLVNQVVPAATIGQTVRDLALEIAANAPLTVRGIKEMGRRLSSHRRLTWADTRDVMEMCYASADFREGVAAFLAKRQPRWTGR
jgi:enoyl-CoA hydratase/carnithine racemase